MAGTNHGQRAEFVSSALSNGHIILITNWCSEETDCFLFTLLLNVQRSWVSRGWVQADVYHYLKNLLRVFFWSHVLVLTVTHVWSSGIESHQILDFDIKFLNRQISHLFWGFPKPFPDHLYTPFLLGSSSVQPVNCYKDDQIGLGKACFSLGH